MTFNDAAPWLELEDYAETLREKHGIPGLSLGVLAGGRVHTAGFGTAHAEKGHPVWGETAFQIGSISKTFTAALAMQFVEAGELDLDAPVRTCLPDFHVADETTSAAVTLRHLLTHSAGWDGDLFLETGDGADALPAFVARLSDRNQIFSPGEFFSYNNSGFAVLGAVLEKVSGEPFERLLRGRIFEPLGLSEAYLNAAEAITEDHAVGHRDGDDGPEVARPWRMPRAQLPVGGIITNAGALLRYAASLMDGGAAPGGSRMLQPDSIARMWTPQLEVHPADRTSIGLSWMRRELDDTFMVSHSGGTNGQITNLALLPEHRFAVTVMTNAEVGRKVTGKITAFALREFLDIDLPAPEAIDSTPADLAPYAGSARRPGFSLHLQMLGDHLVGLLESTVGFPTENEPPFLSDPPFRLGRCADDRLIVQEGKHAGSTIDVIRNEAGAIRFLRLSSRIYTFSQ